MNLDAPWAPVIAGRPKAADCTTAVVYVLETEDERAVKVGRTTQLKQRMTTLREKAGCHLRIVFWAEFFRKDAPRVEALALRFLRETARSDGEWFSVTPTRAAEAVAGAARTLGIKPTCQAGWPDAPGSDVSEAADVCKEARVLRLFSRKHNHRPWHFVC